MTESIIEKIKAEAQIKANSTLEEAGADAGNIIKLAQEDVAIFKKDNLEKTKALREEIIRRRISVANLEVKKLMLAGKKAKLDEVYDKALKNLCNLPKKDYLAIIDAMLSYAEDGDTVMIAEKDKELITPEFILKMAKKHKVDITLSEEFANISGGIMLSNGNMDKNLSFETELNALKEKTIGDIAKQLFGEI